MIDLTINKTGLEHNIQKAKENNIIIPTIAQMQNPDLIPEKIKAKLSHTGLWDVDPVNLFRISWHNEAKEQGGLFQAVPNYVEIPSKLSGVPCRIIAMSGMIGLLTGIWIAEHPRIAPPVMGVCNVLYTIPAISLLGILIPFSGIGNKTAVIALTVYGIMPMVHNTYVGLTTLDPDILEAARGMGSTGTQALFRVKLPMAAGVILAGVRNMVVMTISVAGIASFVGAGGLGVAVYRGITIYDPAMTAAGSILIALLAIVCDLALGALERYFKKRGS